MEETRHLNAKKNMDILNAIYLQEGLWLDVQEITELRYAIDKISDCILQIAPIPTNEQNTLARVIGQILVSRFPHYEE